MSGKSIFIYQFYICGEIVEQKASFQLEQIQKRVKELEDENSHEEDEGETFIRMDNPFETSPDILYYSYDQFARDNGDDEIEIHIREIAIID